MMHGDASIGAELPFVKKSRGGPPLKKPKWRTQRHGSRELMKMEEICSQAEILSDRSYMMEKLREQLKQTISGDVAARSATNLSIVLKNMQKTTQYGDSKKAYILDSMLDHGFCDLIEQAYNASISWIMNDISTKEVFMDMIETIGMIADCSEKGRTFMVEKFGLKLISFVLEENNEFSLKMETVKALNALLEKCPKARSSLQKTQSFSSIMISLASILQTIGDYEIQVGITESLFRLVSKSDRSQAASLWFKDKTVYEAFLRVRDSYFETDCRHFLNIVNKENNRVISAPCHSAFAGNFELKKPDDQSYTDHWVDFNLGSQRITLFCGQELPESQIDEADDEGLWETVCIKACNVSHYTVEENESSVTLKILYSGPCREIVSFGPRTNNPTVTIVFSKEIDVCFAMEAIGTRSKLVSCKITGRKISMAKNPIVITKDVAQDIEVVDYDLEIVPESQLDISQTKCGAINQDITQESITNSQGSGRRKISVPAEAMVTPTQREENRKCPDCEVQNKKSQQLKDIPIFNVRSTPKLGEPKSINSKSSGSTRTSRHSKELPRTTQSSKHKSVKSPLEMVSNKTPPITRSATKVKNGVLCNSKSDINRNEEIREYHNDEYDSQLKHLNSPKKIAELKGKVIQDNFYSKMIQKVSNSPCLSTVTEEGTLSQRTESNRSTPHYSLSEQATVMEKIIEEESSFNEKGNKPFLAANLSTRTTSQDQNSKNSVPTNNKNSNKHASQNWILESETKFDKNLVFHTKNEIKNQRNNVKDDAEKRCTAVKETKRTNKQLKTVNCDSIGHKQTMKRQRDDTKQLSKVSNKHKNDIDSDIVVIQDSQDSSNDYSFGSHLALYGPIVGRAAYSPDFTESENYASPRSENVFSTKSFYSKGKNQSINQNISRNKGVAVNDDQSDTRQANYQFDSQNSNLLPKFFKARAKEKLGNIARSGPSTSTQKEDLSQMSNRDISFYDFDESDTESTKAANKKVQKRKSRKKVKQRKSDSCNPAEDSGHRHESEFKNAQHDINGSRYPNSNVLEKIQKKIIAPSCDAGYDWESFESKKIESRNQKKPREGNSGKKRQTKNSERNRICSSDTRQPLVDMQISNPTTSEIIAEEFNSICKKSKNDENVMQHTGKTQSRPRRRAKKRVNYTEKSESEFESFNQTPSLLCSPPKKKKMSEDVSKRTEKHSKDISKQKKQKKSISLFCDTFENQSNCTDTRSELSWLSKSNRKKPKGSRKYKSKKVNDVQHPEIPSYNQDERKMAAINREIESCDVLDLEIEDETFSRPEMSSNQGKKQKPPSIKSVISSETGNLSKSYSKNVSKSKVKAPKLNKTGTDATRSFEKTSENIVEDSSFDRKTSKTNKIRKPVAEKKSKQNSKSNAFSFNNFEFMNESENQFKIDTWQDIILSPVTKIKGDSFGESSIERARFELKDNSQDNIILRSPVIICQISPESVSSLSDGPDPFSQNSDYSHISSVITPKTPSAKEAELEKVEKLPFDLSVEELSFLGLSQGHHQPLSQTTKLPKSGPTSRIKPKKVNKPTFEQCCESDQSDSEKDCSDATETDEDVSTDDEEADLEMSDFKPRRLEFKKTESERPGDDIFSSLESTDEDYATGIAIPTLLKSFHMEIKKKEQARRDFLDQNTKYAVKVASKHLEKLWHKEALTRHNIVDEYKDIIVSELSALEKDITNFRDSEEKTISFLYSQQKVLESCRKSQQKRLSSLKFKQHSFSEALTNVEDTVKETLPKSTKDALRKVMYDLQKKVLLQSQQRELANIRSAHKSLLFV